MLQELAHVWNDLPEADKGILVGAAFVFGTVLLVLMSATFFLST